MENILYTLAIVLVFGAIIAFHEAGHFFVAKLGKIRVHEFALGLGPRLFGIRRGETDYALRAIPVGGMVRVAGMEPEDIDAPDGFNTKPRYVRVAVIAAGPIMNMVLAAMIFCLLYVVVGKALPTSIIGKVMPGKPAAVAGMLAGDKIISVNGVPSKDFDRMREQIQKNPGRPIPVVIERAGRQLQLTVVPEKIRVTIKPEYKGKELDRIVRVKEWMGQIGIVFAVERKHLPLTESLTQGVSDTGRVMRDYVWKPLALMLRGRAPVELSGPVGIVSLMYEEAQVSWLNLLNFAGIFNVMIAFFNILPFPALDGSRILFLIIEAIRRRPIDPRKEAMVHAVGLVILLLLILVVTAGDIWKKWGPQ